jgi:opacity protein-like surface antigen
MKRLLTSSVLFVVVLLTTPNAFAQEFRNMELNVFISGAAYTKSDFMISFPQTVTPISGDLKLGNAIRGGARFNVNTTRHWGEEFFFSYEPNNARFSRTTPPEQSESFDIRIYNFGFNAMYYFSEEETRGTRPFFSIGIGGTVYQPTASAKQVAQDPFEGNLPGFRSCAELALNYGVGFKQNLGSTLGFRMDVRGFVGRNPSFGLPRTSPDPGTVVFPVFGAIQDVEASAGIIVRFKR